MIDIKKLLSIGKLAKLTNVTIETLRHYDRKGILVPEFTDPKTGYRYYTIMQYYTLELIIELRELNMSIEDIKNYIDDQTVETSLELFEKELKKIKSMIKKLKLVEKNLSNKISLINEFKDIKKIGEIEIKSIKRRKIITLGSVLNDEVDVAYSFLELDSQVSDILPSLIPYGFVIDSKGGKKAKNLFFIIDDIKTEFKNISYIKEGEYASFHYKGDFYECEEFVKGKIIELKNIGYEVGDEVFVMGKIDYAIASLESEHLYEMQILIED